MTLKVKVKVIHIEWRSLAYHDTLFLSIWQHYTDFFESYRADKVMLEGALISKSTKWPWSSKLTLVIFNRGLSLTIIHILCKFHQCALILSKSYWADKVLQTEGRTDRPTDRRSWRQNPFGHYGRGVKRNTQSTPNVVVDDIRKTVFSLTFCWFDDITRGDRATAFATTSAATSSFSLLCLCNHSAAGTPSASCVSVSFSISSVPDWFAPPAPRQRTESW